MAVILIPTGYRPPASSPAAPAAALSPAGRAKWFPAAMEEHHGQEPHHPHPGHGGGPAGTAGPAGQHATGWRMATQATLHCLTGCAIGEVLGMAAGTVLGWHGAGTVALAVVLAFGFGYALTMRGVLRTGVPFRPALRVALAADTVSIAVMEATDNAVMLAVPGAMDADLATARFWGSLAFSLAVAFVAALPVNRWLIAAGRGHAVVHGH